jgi:hypothetical protein
VGLCTGGGISAPTKSSDKPALLAIPALDCDV